MHIIINIINHISSLTPWALERMQPCASCACASSARYTLTVPFETATQVILSWRSRHPLGPISNKMHHLSNFHQHWTRGVAVRAIQNMKFWPFNYSVPIGPISVSLLNARTQIQTAPSCKMGKTVWNITWAVMTDGCTMGWFVSSLGRSK